jgi:UDP-GlcNAc:undecaprenyl-phosphate GlcNAc-1-phosphate transferase
LYILILIQSCIISIITFVLTKETLLTFLDEKELYVRNYSGRKVQTSGGFLLLVSILPTSIPFVFIYTTPIHIFYVLMIITLTFSGLIDDILGDDTIKGLKSHILTFF